jgi:TonB family protein
MASLSLGGHRVVRRRPTRRRRRLRVLAIAWLIAAGLKSTGARAQTGPSTPSRPAVPPTTGSASPDQDEGPTTAGIPAGASGAVLIPPKPGEPAPAAVTPPTLTHFEHAQYPKEALDQELDGSVVLFLDIDASGHVTKAVPVQPIGYGFDEAAAQAALSVAIADVIPLARIAAAHELIESGGAPGRVLISLP